MESGLATTRGTEGAEWTIGGGADCTHRIDASAPRVAVLSREDGRVFLRDLGSGVPVFVNDLRIPPGSRCELARQDLLQIGNTTIELDARVFTGDARLSLDSTRLTYARAGEPGHWLCQGVFIRARPGTVTAILGPSGCGKTVLLDLLNGYARPTSGRIEVGRRFDLRRDFDRIRDLIGYVPQGDVMIPELTVGQSLHYRLRLRYPGMSEAMRGRIVHQTCRQLGFPESEIGRLLERPIGGGELDRKGLSGGERKRINIVHELLGRPAILLLDEPTSGLSSADSDEILGWLGQLARGEGLTLIASVHQPSRVAMEGFDDLLVMAGGGRMAYYGPAARAVGFFQEATDEPFPAGGNAAEYILRLVRQARDADRAVRAFERGTGGCPEPLSETAPEPPSSPPPPVRPPRRPRPGRQWATLVCRNLAVLAADRASLLLAIWQVPLMALVIWLAGYRVEKDGRDYERFSRMLVHFDQGKREDEREGRPIRLEAHAMAAVKAAEAGASGEGTPWISRPAAQRRSAVVFVLVAAATWLGIMGGCREIAGEKPVLRREYRTGLALGPYLAAKLAGLMLVTGLQCGVLVLLVGPGILGYSARATVGLWGVLWLGAIAAAALGLLISAFVSGPRAAMTAVPLVMIPQLLFGGILRPETDVPKDLPWPRLAASLTIQRWAFEPALALDDHPGTRVMIQRLGGSPETYRELWDLLAFEDRPGRAVSLYFADAPAWRRWGVPCSVLGLATLGFLGLGYVRLRRQLLR